MNCHDIIAKYLNDNGYDGLCRPYGECGCGLDDLMPCDGENIAECEPGYKIPDPDHEGCILYGPTAASL